MSGVNGGSTFRPLRHTYQRRNRTISAVVLHHAFYEHNIGHLANFLPLFFWLEDGVITSPNELARIFAIKDRHAGAVRELVVGAVVNENNSGWCEDGSRSGLGHA